VTPGGQAAQHAAIERPLLFVAREPDETLRVYLPVLAELRRRGRDSVVLFHHEPGAWALERLAELDVAPIKTQLPGRPSLAWLGPVGRLGPILAELIQLRRARALGHRLIARLDPAVVVVIQDTLLLERFLVREANSRGRGTLVIQWAFTYPQATYDLLNEYQRGRVRGMGRWGEGESERAGDNQYRSYLISPSPPGRVRVPPISSLYRLLQRALGIDFDLVRSYGGGEARVFAVMGEAFREQFMAQGVRKERIEVTGHPLHDAAFTQRAELTPERVAALKERYGLPGEARVVLYATQPVLWRGVVTPAQLVENVVALGLAVAALGPEFLLVLKLHPRERREQYAPALGQGLPIELIADGEIAELIALAEVFVSSSSSTVLLAMMLDRPIVTVNFNQVPHFDYYETVGGTLHVKSHAAAADALRRVISDQPTRDRLAAERAGVLARYARFDGRAAERLADLVEELAAH
jgi:glycosyltransferase involved in cell wall biosynthesis